jgi:anti-sigma factor RsiW
MTTVDAQSLSCRELVELVTDYVEGVLSPVDRARFEHHLEACDGCTTYVEQLRETIRATGRLSMDDLDAGAEAALLDAFRDWNRHVSTLDNS